MLTEQRKQTILKHTPLTLKKLSTNALVKLHVEIYNAYPVNPFDRDAVRSDVYLYIWREQGGKTQEQIERDNRLEDRATQIVLDAISGKTFVPQMRDSDVIAIRAMYEDGISYANIGKMYNKQPNYIRNIVIGKLYKNVGKIQPEKFTKMDVNSLLRNILVICS